MDVGALDGKIVVAYLDGGHEATLKNLLWIGLTAIWCP